MITTTGMGKSSYAAMRLADTLSGLDCPAIFVHPCEAQHGLLGLVRASTELYAFTQSGETPEVIDLCTLARQHDVGVTWISAGEPPFAGVSWLLTDIRAEYGPHHIDEVPLESVIRQNVIVNDIIRAHMSAMTANQCRVALRRNHPGGVIGERLR